jgi:flagellar biosynthesis/type III secretory pathway chaperone
VLPAIQDEAAALEAQLRRELALLDGLEDLLDRERLALLERDASRILVLSGEKRRSLAGLTETSNLTRERWLSCQKSGLLAADPQFCAQAGALRLAVTKAWTRVRDTNQRNGAVLRLHQASVLRGLAVLRHAVGDSGLYRADGRTTGHYLSA